MKTKLITLLCLVAAVAGAVSYQLSTGYGKEIAVTTNTTQVVITETNVADVYATSLSVYNAGTSTVFCAIACSTAAFVGILSSGVAVPVPQYMTYTFDDHKIQTLCIATTNGTATVYVGAH